MKKLFTLALGSTALMGVSTMGPVQAADFEVDPVSAEDTSGFYLGGSIGYGIAENDVRFYSPPGFESKDTEGNVLGGAFAGYNFNLTEGFVLGVEGDVIFTDIAGTQTDPAVPSGFVLTETKMLYSITGRAGVKVKDVLLYVVGGAAFTDSSHKGSANVAINFESSDVGFTVGGGAEMTIMENWFARLQYKYYRFDDKFGLPAGFTRPHDFTIYLHSITAGVGVRF